MEGEEWSLPQKRNFDNDGRVFGVRSRKSKEQAVQNINLQRALQY